MRGKGFVDPIILDRRLSKVEEDVGDLGVGASLVCDQLKRRIETLEDAVAKLTRALEDRTVIETLEDAVAKLTRALEDRTVRALPRRAA